MTVSVFANCVFFLRVKKLTIQEKKRLKSCITENGGQVAFVLNDKCTHVVTDDADALSSAHLKSIKKYQLPIVGTDFIWNSTEDRRLLPSIEEGRPLPTDNSRSPQTPECITEVNIISTCGDNSEEEKETIEKNVNSESKENRNIKELRWCSKNDENVCCFPDDFCVAKHDVLEKVTVHGEYVVVELQCSQQPGDYPFCISEHYSTSDNDQDEEQFIPVATSEEARTTYELAIKQLKDERYQLREDFPHEAEHLASVQLQEVLVAEASNSSTLSEEVAVFVEQIWVEALGHLDQVLAKPVTSISLNDVSKAEGVLLRTKNALDEMELSNELNVMMSEFYKIIPHKSGLDYEVNKKLLSEKQDLCQLIRDMLNVHETNMSTQFMSSLSHYRALRCKIDALDTNSEEFHRVKQQLVESVSKNCPIEIVQIFKVARLTEAAGFEKNIYNVQSLYHASSPCNFVGILSRGLLLPKMVVEEHGLERTDSGKLGSGIYFSSSIRSERRTTIKYSQPSKTDGTRWFVVCDVALGSSWFTDQKDSSLTMAPSDYDSVHGIFKQCDYTSEFEDDEYVVYRTSQVKIKYVVKFRLDNDDVKEFHPKIQTELEEQPPSLEHDSQPKDYEMPTKKPSDVTAGLLDGSGNPVPLKDVHIRGKIIDFVAEVVLFQTYENQTDSPIEAKYVFPLDDTAAVCGFEAFIKGKHIIGEVKEKEKAHQEYREAISRGDGAYLMDQNAPDIFTVSVGNLPPLTKVLIKITYIMELSYASGCLSFCLPAAVAPWQQDKALNENTQESVKKVSIKQVGTKPGDFSLEMSIEMPFKINDISCWTHLLKTKKTDCKAVICTVENSCLDMSGFAMVIRIGDVHLPRMWVEKHPKKGSEACMLVFQPKFEAPLSSISTVSEIIICLDCSNSMAGSEIQHAKQIALHALDACCLTARLSVIKFGTNFIELPSNPGGLTSSESLAALKKFVTSATPTMGNSDLWKPLHYLSLLFPSKAKRNIILISDGHIQNEGMTLELVKKNVQHTRIFTCGVGPAANRHMLRSLSQYGAGAFEYFDIKSAYNWETQIRRQATRMFSPGCSAVSIKWQQFDIDAPELLYAPVQIQSLFNNEHLLIYGFISHCTQATLKALIGDKELQTMVFTTELQKTTGTMLHKLAARAFITDYEQGILAENEAEHEMKKQMLKSLIIKLSLENSIVTQFTSFVAIERRDASEDQAADTLNVLGLVAKEDVDILPYMQYQLPTQRDKLCSGNLYEKVKDASDENAGTMGDFELDFFSMECDLPMQRQTSQQEPSDEDFADILHGFGIDFSSMELPTQSETLHQQVKVPLRLPVFQHSSTAPQPSQQKYMTSSLSFQPLSPMSASQEVLPSGGYSLGVSAASFPSPRVGFLLAEKTNTATRLLSIPQTQVPLRLPVFQHSSTAPQPSQQKYMTSSLSFQPLSPMSASQEVLQSDGNSLGVSAASFPSPRVGFGAAEKMPNVSIASPDYTHVFYPVSPHSTFKRLSLTNEEPLTYYSSRYFRRASLVAENNRSHASTLFGQEYNSSPLDLCFHAPAPPSAPPISKLEIPETLQCDMLSQEQQSIRAQRQQARCLRKKKLKVFHQDSSKILLEASLPSPKFVQKSRSTVMDEVESSEKMPVLDHHVHPHLFSSVSTASTLPSSLFKEKVLQKLAGKKSERFTAAKTTLRKPLSTVSWPQLFKLQNQEGFWQLSPELGTLLDLDVDHLVNVMLAKKGIQSLGLKGKEKLLQLIATLLVLQAIRFNQLEGLVFKSLMKLNDLCQPWAFEAVKKAVEWARRTNQQFSGICQRLELGKDWDSATKKLLHI